MFHSSQMKQLLLALLLTTLTSHQVIPMDANAAERQATKSSEPPMNTEDIGLATSANSAFAIQLYATLAQDDPAENVFFSPFSISTALAAVAEGARGRTAEEFGRALRMPQEIRNRGSESNARPWDLARYHAGLSGINQALTPATTDTDQRVRKRLAELEAQLSVINLKIRTAQALSAYSQASKYRREGTQLAREINILRTQIDQYRISVANAIWVDDSFPIARDYQATMKRYYGIDSIFAVDFQNQPEAQRARINRWGSQQTESMIPEILPPGAIKPLTRLVLANAVFFQGEWQKPFEERRTRPAPFTLGSGSEISVPMMRTSNSVTKYAAFNADGSSFATPREIPFGVRSNANAEDGPQHYPDSDGFEIVELPYKGNEVSMLIIAPRDPGRLAAIEKLIAPQMLQEWLLGLKSWDSVRLSIPRFELTTSYTLAQTLKRLGLTSAFEMPVNGQGADLTGLSEHGPDGEQLSISEVFHRAKIEVNEKGTRAAAVTAIAVDAASAAPETRPFIPEFRADRPFVFMIRHRPTGTILFMGRVTSPVED